MGPSLTGDPGALLWSPQPLHLIFHSPQVSPEFWGPSFYFSFIFKTTLTTSHLLKTLLQGPGSKSQLSRQAPGALRALAHRGQGSIE